MKKMRAEYEFENYVNYAGSKTSWGSLLSVIRFENYVNYAGSKTSSDFDKVRTCLRTM